MKESIYGSLPPRPVSISDCPKIPCSGLNERKLSSATKQNLSLDISAGMLSLSKVFKTDPSLSLTRNVQMKSSLEMTDEKAFAIAESLPEPRQTICEGKSNPCGKNSLNLRLSRTLGVGLTTNVRAFSGYSKEQLKSVSQQLWFPTGIDSQGSDSNCSSGCWNIMESNSWFLNKRWVEAEKTNFVRTCSPS